MITYTGIVARAFASMASVPLSSHSLTKSSDFLVQRRSKAHGKTPPAITREIPGPRQPQMALTTGSPPTYILRQAFLNLAVPAVAREGKAVKLAAPE